MRRSIYLIISLLIWSVGLHAQDEKKKVDFVYDVNFEMNFDNREFYRSAFSSSMTIFGARLTPAVGLEAVQKDGTSHRIMAGIDVMKDFGSANKKTLSVFQEISLYYRLKKDFGDTDMTLYAGIFPRRNMSDRYSEAFFSDSLKFYDNNLEGILLKFKRPKAEFEVGCDWIGQYSENQRERFMIFTSGEGQVAPVMSVGYAGYMYHFANTWHIKGLVDNFLLNPYIRFDFAQYTGLQKLSATVGYLQAFQNNRKHVGYYIFPRGVHLDLEARKWNAAIKNMAFYGTNMMPYYNFHDEGGIKYGSNLYFGDPFYRIHDDGNNGAGLYDRLEICYEPRIGKHLQLRVAALFHFHNFHYSGCQQMVGVLASF